MTLVLLMEKWLDLALMKNRLVRCCNCLSLLNWIGALTLLKLCLRKIRGLMGYVKPICSKVVFYLNKSTI